MWCIKCEYCGATYRSFSYEEAKKMLREHMVREHDDELLKIGMDCGHCDKFDDEEICIRWIAGAKAFINSEECDLDMFKYWEEYEKNKD